MTDATIQMGYPVTQGEYAERVTAAVFESPAAAQQWADKWNERVRPQHAGDRMVVAQEPIPVVAIGGAAPPLPAETVDYDDHGVVIDDPGAWDH